MNTATMERFEKYMRDKKTVMPDIRYFDGTCSFSTADGKYKAKTLEQSLELFLTDEGY